MAWDSSRPVPWLRLTREWLVYVGIMAVVFALFFRDDGLVGILAGLLVSGPLYLGVGYLLAKLGYRRKSYGELREERRSSSSGDEPTRDVDQPRARPAPTKRTGGTAPNRKQAKRRR